MHPDALGTVRYLTNDTGALVGSRAHDPWGTPVAGSTGASRFGYAGEWTDPTTGLVNLRARWYDPATGQFLSLDPLYAATGDRYGYGAGNPVENTDPTGLWCLIHNDDGGCMGSGVVDAVKTYGDNVAGWSGGIALACLTIAYTPHGAACATIAGYVSNVATTFHAAAECGDDGFMQAECQLLIGQSALGWGTFGASNGVMHWGKNAGAIGRSLAKLSASGIDFAGGLAGTGWSLQETGWYGDGCEPDTVAAPR